MGLTNNNYSEPVSLEDMTEVEETVGQPSTEMDETEQPTEKE